MNTNIMYEALGKARDMFKLYAELHRAKGTVDSDAKAKVNEDMVAIMNEALSVHPDALPELPVSEAFSLTRSVYTADDMYAYARAAIAERDALATNLLAAERTLRDRAHPAREPRDPPECLRTLGFWPDCGCGECYAIHCLDNAMAERDALRAALLDTARRVEALKRPCGMDPESAQAIRNGEYMSIALTARAIERLILGEQG